MPMVFMTAQALILRLDILRTGTHMLPNAEFLGHMAPYFAVAACSLEYRFFYSERQVAVTWGLVMLAFFAHFMMALRFLDLAYPEVSRTGGMRKRKGNKVAVKTSSPGKGDQQPIDRDEQFRTRRNDLPWQVMRVACCAAALSWAFMMVATCVEILLGPESLLKPPGEPPWIRDTKFRSWTPAMMHSSASAGLPDDYRLFSASTAIYDDDTATEKHATADDAHGSHRRLASANKTSRDAVFGDLLKTLPLLEELADRVSNHEVYVAGGDGPAMLAQPAGFMTAGPKALSVEWPVLFEPKHVLSGHDAGRRGNLLTLTRRGFGAMIAIGSDDARSETESFSLEGMYEPIAGARWGAHGLHLVSSGGRFMHCPGNLPVNGVWSCEATPHSTFPVPAGSEILAAALKETADDAKDASAEPVLALIFKNLPKSVMLYSSSGDSWRPSGEMHLPIVDDAPAGLNFHGDDLLISTATGEIHRRSLRGGASSVVVAPPPITGRHFTSACPLEGKGFVRLGLRQMLNDGGIARSPELLFSD